jgi:hypothetical protein
VVVDRLRHDPGIRHRWGAGAIRAEQREIFSWLFNAACYRTLNGASFTEIKPLLLRAWHASVSAQRTWFLAALRREPDLGALRSTPEFDHLVSTLERRD